MDDSLKTYAKQRRDEAGSAAQLHPATRRLLQAEVAKLRPNTSERPPSWFNSMAALWPRLAFAASVVMLLGVTAWVLWQPVNDAGQTLRFAKRDAEAVPAQGSAGLGESQKKDVEKGRVPSPMKEEAMVKLRHGVELESAGRTEEKPRALAERSTRTNAADLRSALTRTGDAARGSPPEVSREGAKVAKAGKPEAAQGPVDAVSSFASVAPVAGPNVGKDLRIVDELDRKASSERAQNRFYRTTAGEAQNQGAALARSRFAQVQQPATIILTAAKQATVQPTQVLADFVIEQTGDRLRVVDADQSVYEGQWIGDDRAASDSDEKSADPAERRDAEGRREREEGRSALPSRFSPLPSQVWNFRVSGTNRTLGQPVTLEGRLFEDGGANQSVQAGPADLRSALTGPPQSRPAAQPRTPALQVQNGPATSGQQGGSGVSSMAQQNNAAAANLLNVRRIQGQVRVGATNRAPFEAVRSGN